MKHPELMEPLVELKRIRRLTRIISIFGLIFLSLVTIFILGASALLLYEIYSKYMTFGWKSVSLPIFLLAVSFPLLYLSFKGLFSGLGDSLGFKWVNAFGRTKMDYLIEELERKIKEDK